MAYWLNPNEDLRGYTEDQLVRHLDRLTDARESAIARVRQHEIDCRRDRVVARIENLRKRRRKLNEVVVRQVLLRIESGESLVHIAKSINVAQSLISNIAAGRIWGDVVRNYRAEKKGMLR